MKEDDLLYPQPLIISERAKDILLRCGIFTRLYSKEHPEYGFNVLKPKTGINRFPPELVIVKIRNTSSNPDAPFAGANFRRAIRARDEKPFEDELEEND
jgi:hypothetical protein